MTGSSLRRQILVCTGVQSRCCGLGGIGCTLCTASCVAIASVIVLCAATICEVLALPVKPAMLVCYLAQVQYIVCTPDTVSDRVAVVKYIWRMPASTRNPSTRFEVADTRTRSFEMTCAWPSRARGHPVRDRLQPSKLLCSCLCIAHPSPVLHTRRPHHQRSNPRCAELHRRPTLSG